MGCVECVVVVVGFRRRERTDPRYSHRERTTHDMTSQPLDTYTKTTATEHEQDKRTIATILTQDHRGRDNPISSTELAERTHCGPSTVRDLIKEVRREFRIPIGSANGYFVIEDVDVYRQQVERQLKQSRTSEQVAGDISAAFNSWFYGRETSKNDNQKSEVCES